MDPREIERLKNTWDHLGKVDPMWAILTADPAKLGHGWDKDEFFATGRNEIDALVDELQTRGIAVKFGAALDFGCGLGRLTQALARHFERVTGVDIAPSMIEGARHFNAFGERCDYVVNDRPDLRLFESGSFDFVYSTQVLQHIPVNMTRAYIAEFCRVAKPGGVIVFQLPEAVPLNARTRLFHAIMPLLLRLLPGFAIRAYRRLKYRNATPETIASLPRNIMEMHGLSKQLVTELLAQSGAKAVYVRQNTEVGTTWTNWQYYAVKS